jgi:hypothetical protein
VAEGPTIQAMIKLLSEMNGLAHSSLDRHHTTGNRGMMFTDAGDVPREQRAVLLQVLNSRLGAERPR